VQVQGDQISVLCTDTPHSVSPVTVNYRHNHYDITVTVKFPHNNYIYTFMHGIYNSYITYPVSHIIAEGLPVVSGRHVYSDSAYA